MAGLRKQFEATIKDLEEVLALNIKEQKDIKSLRDQLFSGTSVKESREAIKQNDNIKLLTLVTIFFLPLTFVSFPPLLK
jgi:Mg2+ and Co2+ transporter CorA